MAMNNGFSRGFGAAVIGAFLVTLPFAPQLLGGETDGKDSHMPANKGSVAGSTVEWMTAPLVDGASSSTVDLFETTHMRTAKPTDLVVQLTLECALFTNVLTQGNAESESMASVKVWVEFDGEPVLIDPDGDGEDDGKVTFCNRAHMQRVSDLDDEDAQLEQYLDTRTANSFNWIVLNAGSDIHTIEVKAQLEAETTGAGDAKAGVGKRTLFIEPHMFANDEAL